MDNLTPQTIWHGKQFGLQRNIVYRVHIGDICPISCTYRSDPLKKYRSGWSKPCAIRLPHHVCGTSSAICQLRISKLEFRNPNERLPPIYDAESACVFFVFFNYSPDLDIWNISATIQALHSIYTSYQTEMLIIPHFCLVVCVKVKGG